MLRGPARPCGRANERSPMCSTNASSHSTLRKPAARGAQAEVVLLAVALRRTPDRRRRSRRSARGARRGRSPRRSAGRDRSAPPRARAPRAPAPDRRRRATGCSRRSAGYEQISALFENGVTVPIRGSDAAQRTSASSQPAVTIGVGVEQHDVGARQRHAPIGGAGEARGCASLAQQRDVRQRAAGELRRDTRRSPGRATRRRSAPADTPRGVCASTLSTQRARRRGALYTGTTTSTAQRVRAALMRRASASTRASRAATAAAATSGSDCRYAMIRSCARAPGRAVASRRARRCARVAFVSRALARAAPARRCAAARRFVVATPVSRAARVRSRAPRSPLARRSCSGTCTAPRCDVRVRSSSASRSATSRSRERELRAARACVRRELRVALGDDALALGEQRSRADQPLEMRHVRAPRELRVALDDDALALLEQAVEADAPRPRAPRRASSSVSPASENSDSAGVRRRAAPRRRARRRRRNTSAARHGAAPTRVASPDQRLDVARRRLRATASTRATRAARYHAIAGKVHRAAGARARRDRARGDGKDSRSRAIPNTRGGSAPTARARRRRRARARTRRACAAGRPRRGARSSRTTRRRRRSRRQRQRRRRSPRRTRGCAATRTRLARMRDRRGVDVDAGDVGRRVGEERAAVAFAARDVEHAPAGDVAPRERVAMHVLVDDLAADAGDEALAGEFEVGGHDR